VLTAATRRPGHAAAPPEPVLGCEPSQTNGTNGNREHGDPGGWRWHDALVIGGHNDIEAGSAPTRPQALGHVRICDLSGQLAGAGATRLLAAFGAEVIRIEDPVNKGLWDIVRQMAPKFPGDSSHEGGTGFNNHNVNKLGITLNLRTARGKELLAEIVRRSDAVTENFAAGVMDRLGFGYEQLKALKPDIVYVSNCGFGHVGPYGAFKSWGPITQAVSGMTFQSGLPDREPAGWGYSYMDHTGAYTMAIALLAALWHRQRTGIGQWVDMSCTEAGAAMNGPALLDATVNNRPLRRPGSPSSNRSTSPAMAPHGIYPTAEDDCWVAIACRDDDDWSALRDAVGAAWANESVWSTLAGRCDDEDRLDALLSTWTAGRERAAIVAVLRAAGVPVAPVASPRHRADHDAENVRWGMFPAVPHTRHGPVRVDGVGAHLSATDWHLRRGGPLLGEDNERVLGDLLGLSSSEIEQLRADGVI